MKHHENTLSAVPENQVLSDKGRLIAHYQSLLSKYGNSAQAVQLADTPTQKRRFDILMQIAGSLNSVLDVGCGLGELYVHLGDNGFKGRYCGIDVVPEFVDFTARRTADDENATAMLVDASNEDLPTGYDYGILSGVFNNRMSDNLGFMETTLKNMFFAAEEGIAFNAMSTWVDYQDDDLWYVDPMQVFAFCKDRLGGHPVLRHEYVTREGAFPFEFAMYVYKSPR